MVRADFLLSNPILRRSYIPISGTTEVKIGSLVSLRFFFIINILLAVQVNSNTYLVPQRIRSHLALYSEAR